MVSLKQSTRSLRYALRGFRFVWRENNFRIQVFAGAIIITLMFYFRLSRMEKVALILVITTILILEALNTIFEHLSDILEPRLHDYVKVIKDIMAAVVLLASVTALIIGLMIFWPYFFS